MCAIDVRLLGVRRWCTPVDAGLPVFRLVGVHSECACSEFAYSVFVTNARLLGVRRESTLNLMFVIDVRLI